jgi:Asp-tRNA(Asn)/Glu-tRNA(Gln) amidotransferase A subunit family amidase
MAELHQASAAELLALYQAREASPVEATRAVMAHIERWEPRLKRDLRLRPRRRAGTGACQRGALAEAASLWAGSTACPRC